MSAEEPKLTPEERAALGYDEPAQAAPSKEPTLSPEEREALGEEPAKPKDEPQEDKIAPYGTQGIITGKRGPGPPDTSLAASASGAFTRGASLGLGPVLGAGIDTLVSKVPGVRTAAEWFNSIGGHPGLSPLTADIPYAQRLAEMRARDDAQRAAHPYVSPLVEGLGGVTTAALAPARAAQAIAQGQGIGRAALAGAKAGAALGGISAAGESRAEDIGGKAKDIAIGAGVGAATGAALETGAAVLTRKAGQRMAKDITRHISEGTGEHGAGTKTARDAVARDKNDIVALVTSDPAVAKAVRQPAEKGLPTVKAAISREGSQLGPLYDVIDRDAGGVRVGDYVDHLEKEAGRLRASAKGKDEQVAIQLEKAATRAREGADWGGVSTFDPNVEVTPGVTAGQQIALMQRVAKIPANAAAAQAEIDRVMKFATRKAYDPNRIVPSAQLRGVVSDLQSTAYGDLGGINGTNAHEKSVQVAHAGEDFLRAHLEKAEGASDAAANAVADIRAINPRFSALKNIERAMEQRGKNEAGGARSYTTKMFHAGGGLSAVHALATGHPGRAAAEIAGAYVLPKVAGVAGPAANRVLAKLVTAANNGKVLPGLIRQAIEAGIPREIAMKAGKLSREDIEGAVGGTVGLAAGDAP